MTTKIVDQRNKCKVFSSLENSTMFEVSGILYMKTAVATGAKANAVRMDTGTQMIFQPQDTVWEAKVEVVILG